MNLTREILNTLAQSEPLPSADIADVTGGKIASVRALLTTASRCGWVAYDGRAWGITASGKKRVRSKPRRAAGAVAADICAILKRDEVSTAVALAEEIGLPRPRITAVLSALRDKQMVRMVGGRGGTRNGTTWHWLGREEPKPVDEPDYAPMPLVDVQEAMRWVAECGGYGGRMR